jgi:hypothetical protein
MAAGRMDREAGRELGIAVVEKDAARTIPQMSSTSNECDNRGYRMKRPVA